MDNLGGYPGTIDTSHGGWMSVDGVELARVALLVRGGEVFVFL